MQEAIADASEAGIGGIGSAAQLLAGGPSVAATSSSAAELKARRVSGFWLSQYLSVQQQGAFACLSLFAAIFDTAGAAAVLHGVGPTVQQQADVAEILRGLRDVGVVQEVQQPAVSGQPRHSMHPLVRDLGAELRGKQPADGQDAATIGFVAYMLRKGGTELAALERTAAAAPVAARLLAWEARNFAAMLRIVAAPCQTRAGAMLQEDSLKGKTCRKALDDMSAALSYWGQLALAAEAGRVAWKARRRWPEHPDTLASMANLSLRLSEVAQYEAAANMTQQVVTVRQRVQGPKHPETLTSMADLSDNLTSLQQWEAAAEISQQVLTARQRVLGPEHPDTLDSMKCLILDLGALGRKEAAAEVAQQLLTAQQRVLEPDHPDTLDSMCGLSRRLSELEQYEAAAELAQQVLTARQSVQGPDHTDTLDTMDDLSMMLAELGQPEAAADMARQALAARQRVLVLDDPSTPSSFSDLSIRLAALGEHGPAVDMARQALAGHLRVLGPEHPNTWRSMDGLGERLAESGDHEAAAEMARQAQAARDSSWTSAP